MNRLSLIATHTELQETIDSLKGVFQNPPATFLSSDPIALEEQKAEWLRNLSIAQAKLNRLRTCTLNYFKAFEKRVRLIHLLAPQIQDALTPEFVFLPITAVPQNQLHGIQPDLVDRASLVLSHRQGTLTDEMVDACSETIEGRFEITIQTTLEATTGEVQSSKEEVIPIQVRRIDSVIQVEETRYQLYTVGIVRPPHLRKPRRVNKGTVCTE